MKRCFLTFMSAVLLCACVREVPAGHEEGAAVRFGASAWYQNGNDTRTEYSGKDENDGLVGRGSAYERIDWVPGKDFIDIVSPQAYGTTLYRLSAKSDDGRKSLGTFEAVSEGGLQWGGEMVHYFYAAYPGKGSKDKYNNPDTGTSAEVIALVSGQNKAVITGEIPAGQSAVRSGNIFKPDMTRAYMYAMAKKSRADQGDVILEFHPLVTTFEFTLLAMDDEVAACHLKSLALSSSSTKLAGRFTAELDYDGGETDADRVEITPAAGGLSDEVTVLFPAEGRPQLSKTVPLTVTVLTLPVRQTDLTLTLTFLTPESAEMTRTLDLVQRGSPISVDACKKIYIRNLAVPADDFLDVYITDQIASDVKQDVAVTNTGNVPEYIRVAVIGTWQDDNGVIKDVWDETSGTFVGLPGAGWSLGADGFYYYSAAIAPDASPAAPLFTSYTPPSRSDGLHLVLDLAVQAIEAPTDVSYSVAWDAILNNN